jgi:hypothetical protein
MQQAVYLVLIEGNHEGSGGAVHPYSVAVHMHRHKTERLQLVFP